MSAGVTEERNRRMFRDRDAMDRAYVLLHDGVAAPRRLIKSALSDKQPQPEFKIVLMRPGTPVHGEETTAEIRALMTKGGAGGGLIIETDDCQADYERLLVAGVEFTQEPIERFYGTDCPLRDPFGNPVRLTQPPDGPIVVPSAEEFQAPQ